MYILQAFYLFSSIGNNLTTITLATTKGGAGKTTIAQVIIGTVHDMGYSIGVIDGDATAGEWDETEAASDVLTIEQINAQGILQSIYFLYDEAEIRPDQRAKLQANAAFLRENSSFRVLIAGHCDERGTREYNIALGEQRASATMQYLVSLGIPRNRIEIRQCGVLAQ